METRLQNGGPEESAPGKEMTRLHGDAARRARWLSQVPPAGTLLCTIDEIDDPGAKGFTFGEGRDRFDMFVVKKEGDIFAYVNACPHAFTTLETFTDRFLTRDKSQVICTTHGAFFNIDDGFCTSGPCAGKSLVPIPINVANGSITIAETEE